jgi:hypothetical protein
MARYALPGLRVGSGSRVLHAEASLLSWHNGAMKGSNAKEILEIACPTCGAKPGEQCELSTGQPRKTPHRDRRVTAKQTSAAHNATKD